MRTPFRLLPVAVLAAASLGLAACGGSDDDGPSAEEQEAIRQAIVAAVTTQDAEERCAKVLTDGLVREIYGDAATCRKVEGEPDPDDEPARDAKVSGIAVDGANAKARVEVVGGDTPGATGGLELQKVEDTWRVSSLGVDLLRSQLEKGLSKPDSELPLDDEGRKCLLDRLNALPDVEFRALAYGAIAERESSTRQLTQALGACTAVDEGADGSKAGEDPGGSAGKPSALRKLFEQGIAESLEKDGATKQVSECVNRRLRDTITDEQIGDQVARGGEDVAPEVAGAVAAALAACK